MEAMEGLTTYHALKSLIDDLKTALESHQEKWTVSKGKGIFVKVSSTQMVTKIFANLHLCSNLNQECSIIQETSLFPWSSICLTILNILVLIVGGIHLEDSWLLIEACLIFLLLCLNVGLNIYHHHLHQVEMPRRLQSVMLKLERHLTNGVYWSQENYPHLHTPLSASAVLQWTIRDGLKVVSI